MIITGACVNTQSCPTLSGHMDCNSPVSSVHGIFQARILELIAVSFSGSSQSKNKTRASCITRRILYRRACHLWSPHLRYLCMLSRSVMSHSMWPHGLQPARLLCPWDSPGKNTGVGCHFLLQGIFTTQGLYPGLLSLQIQGPNNWATTISAYPGMFLFTLTTRWHCRVINWMERLVYKTLP